MSFLEMTFSVLGLAVLIYRTLPWGRLKVGAMPSNDRDLVSIIVPCRNEEANVVPLIRSLKNLAGLQTEIIIVDDQSVDRTAELAAKEDVILIRSATKPEGWVGKSWACAQGAKVARGDFLLFTDADTLHRPRSLVSALSFMQSKKADLISAPPFHQCRSWWERGLGLFHLLPLVATGFPHHKRKQRLYAIGQYLLFSRRAYEASGGHESVRGSLVEDIDLAKKILSFEFSYSIYPQADLYEVQMYDGFQDFWNGWKRLLRLGMKTVSVSAFVEITLIFVLFFQFNLMSLFAVIILAVLQRAHGAFALWGAILAPASLVLFALLSLTGKIDQIRNRKIVWQGREYVEI